MMKRRMEKTAVFVLAAVFLGTGQAVCLPVLAASPEFAYTQEEWAALQDDRLEYDEIEKLIREYNVTYQNNLGEYREFIREYGTSNEELSDAYRELAEEIYGSIGDGDDASSMISSLQLEAQAENLEKQADEAVDDGETYALTYEQAAKSLVASAQSRMMSYHRQKLNLELQDAQSALNHADYSLTEARAAAGMATQMELLDAQAELKNNEKSLASQRAQLEQTRQNLIVMLGWKSGDQPEIGVLPQVSLEELAAVDLAADKEKALENNYTLRINRKKLSNSSSDSVTNSLKNTIEDNEKKVLNSVESAYQSLQAAKLSYEQSEAAGQTAQAELQIAAAKLQAGMITVLGYQKQELLHRSALISVETAKIDLLEAYETYRWNVNGLAGTQ